MRFASPPPGPWKTLLGHGRLTLVNGPRGTTRGVLQEIAHHALQESTGAVLWCDGDHGFDPYDFAEQNLEHGLPADHAAERVLIKRCMTPFQWDTVLTKHLDQKLVHTQAALVIAAPYDRLFSTDELSDWEQEDYVRYSLKHLRRLARRHEVPVLIVVNMPRLWRTHPILAKMAFEAADTRWMVEATRSGWRVIDEATGRTLRPPGRRSITLDDFGDEVPLPRPARRPLGRQMPWFQTEAAPARW